MVPGDQPPPPVFEILEHPADIGFRAFGGSLEELFENAALALTSIVLETEAVVPREQRALEAAGADYESLLVAWLSEVLYWLDGRRFAFRKFRVNTLGTSQLSAEGWGEPRGEGHPARLIVKGVTWHQLKIDHTPNGWMAEVYLDV